jgi:hypothetical protein
LLTGVDAAVARCKYPCKDGVECLEGFFMAMFFRAVAAIAEIVVKEKANGGQKSLTVYAYCS